MCVEFYYLLNFKCKSQYQCWKKIYHYKYEKIYFSKIYSIDCQINYSFTCFYWYFLFFFRLIFNNTYTIGLLRYVRIVSVRTIAVWHNARVYLILISYALITSLGILARQTYWWKTRLAIILVRVCIEKILIRTFTLIILKSWFIFILYSNARKAVLWAVTSRTSKRTCLMCLF
jgi:hypothetical protein